MRALRPLHTSGDTNKRHETANNSEANFDARVYAHRERRDLIHSRKKTIAVPVTDSKHGVDIER